MAKLSDSLHLDMHNAGKRRRRFASKLKKAINALTSKDDIYGLEWGDPDKIPPLKYVRQHFLLPYITKEKTIVEIGPGGGRWTRYMINAKRIYAVDYHQELLDELKVRFNSSNILFVKNNGSDFPGVPEESVDFVFSFGVFVHLDLDIIQPYLYNLKPLLKPGSNVVLQYSDKTKPLAKKNRGFADNDPDTMRELVLSEGYGVYEEDTKSLWHSSIIRFGLPRQFALTE